MKKSQELENLEAKINGLVSKEHGFVSEGRASDYKTAARIGFQITAELLAAVIVGGSLGYFLDAFFDTRPYFLVFCLLFGGAAGLLNIYRLAKEAENQEDK